MTICQRKEPSFSSKHMTMPRSPSWFSSRGDSLLVPMSTLPSPMVGRAVALRADLRDPLHVLGGGKVDELGALLLLAGIHLQRDSGGGGHHVAVARATPLGPVTTALVGGLLFCGVAAGGSRQQRHEAREKRFRGSLLDRLARFDGDVVNIHRLLALRRKAEQAGGRPACAPWGGKRSDSSRRARPPPSASTWP